MAKIIGMKTLLLICLVLFSFVSQRLKAQTPTDGQGDYWVVIGAFAVQENANKHTSQARKLGMKTRIELNAEKNLYYVVALRTPDREAAIAEALKIRGSGRLSDTWVFTKSAPAPKIEEKPQVVVETPPTVIPEPVVTPPPPVVLSKEEQIKIEVDKKDMTLKKGNTETLDYIFFYKDASVLRPESRFAVDKLVRILKENPGEKIRIHGHTNGNDPGKIIKRTNADDFFSLDNTVEDYGSAKELSQLRAEAIRDYLVANGINKDRMSIKAWGGKKGLYPVDDDKAEANVRVEIEVLN
jgi:outer membrane protein OmpA-like peptidoglycan-associated protein